MVFDGKQLCFFVRSRNFSFFEKSNIHKRHFVSEIVVEHKLASFSADGGSCCLPVSLDDRHDLVFH